jgi:hypothetical protein
LHDSEEIFTLRDQVEGAETLAALPSREPDSPLVDQNVVHARIELPSLRAQLQAALERHGFANLAEFDAAVLTWRQGFEREARRMGEVLLDQLDHLLFEQQRRYSDPTSAAALAQRVAGTGASAHYVTSREQAARSIRLSTPRNAMDDGSMVDEHRAFAAAAASSEAAEAGEHAVRGLVQSDPLVDFNDFPRELLANSDNPRGVMLDYIAQHRASIQSTRVELNSDPEFIYKLDVLLAAARHAQDAETGIYAQIIDEHIREPDMPRMLRRASTHRSSTSTSASNIFTQS